MPDLRAPGLQFIRTEGLQFHGPTVLWLVYLPKRRAPIALGLVPAASQPEGALPIDGQQALDWHAGGWAHVVICALPLEQLQVPRGSCRRSWSELIVPGHPLIQVVDGREQMHERQFRSVCNSDVRRAVRCCATILKEIPR